MFTGSSESRDVSASEPSKSQPQQEQGAPEAVTEHKSPERKLTPPVPTPKFHQPLDFPMPPMGAMETEHLSFNPHDEQPQASAPWQQHHNPYRQQREGFQQQQHQQQQQQQQQAYGNATGRQLRQRSGNPGQVQDHHTSCPWGMLMAARAVDNGVASHQDGDVVKSRLKIPQHSLNSVALVGAAGARKEAGALAGVVADGTACGEAAPRAEDAAEPQHERSGALRQAATAAADGRLL